MLHPAPAAPVHCLGPALRRADPRLRRLEAALGVLLLLAVLTGVRAEVAGPVRVTSGSMAPTLLAGDVVLVDRTGLDVDDLHRGDLVTFPHPRDRVESLKRVVALPGDTVAIIDAVLHVNGEPVEEPYVDFSEWEGMFAARVLVPPATVYVLGDDRLRSVDSRDFGPVRVESLDGRVLVRLWPPLRLGAEPPAPARP